MFPQRSIGFSCNKNDELALPEQHLLQVGHGGRSALLFIAGADDGGVAEALGLRHAYVVAGDGAYLPVEIHFAPEHTAFRERDVVEGGEQGRYEGEVEPRFLQAHAAADLGVDVHLPEVEAKVLFQHGDEQVQAVHVEAEAGAAGDGKVAPRGKGLYFHGEGALAVHSHDHGRAAQCGVACAEEECRGIFHDLKAFREILADALDLTFGILRV